MEKEKCWKIGYIENNTTMELKSIKDIKQGDVISFDNGNTRAVYNHKCMRQNGKYDVYVFGTCREIKVEPTAMVPFYGKCENVNLWDDQSKGDYANEIWNGLKQQLPTDVAATIESTYGGRLFGKRGRYSLTNKDYLVRNYKQMLKLRDIVEQHNGIVSVNVSTYDDMENLEDSIRLETECYGYRVYRLQLQCGDGSGVTM